MSYVALAHNALNDLITVGIWNQLLDNVAYVYGSAVQVLDRKVTSTDVVSSTTETAVYSYSVPGGTLGSTRALRCVLVGDYLNSSGSSINLQIKAKYGATTIFDTTATLMASVASRRSEYVEVRLHAANATSAQVAWGRWSSGGTGSAAGISGSAQEWAREATHTSVAEDSTAAKTFQITVQHSVVNANVSFREFGVVLELM